MNVRIGGLAIFLGVIATASAAQDTQTSFWIGANAGLGTYSMGDLNDDIESLNVATGLNMDEITKGYAFSFEAGMGIGSSLTVGAGYERLTASSEVGDFSGRLEYNVPANLFYGLIHFTAESTSPFHIGLEGGAGLVSAAGEVKLAITGIGAASGDVEGSGPTFYAKVLGDYFASPTVVITPSVGYRFAKIPEFEIAGSPVYNSDGSRMELDYSGLMLRLGLRIVLG